MCSSDLVRTKIEMECRIIQRRFIDRSRTGTGHQSLVHLGVINVQDESLKELASSIETNGLIQPIIVRKKDEAYEIVAGERRWRASKSIDLKEIPAIIREIDEESAAKISLIENIQRENLNPIEEAHAYKRVMKDYELKQDELGKAVGKSRTYISNCIRLLNLDERVVELL